MGSTSVDILWVYTDTNRNTYDFWGRPVLMLMFTPDKQSLVLERECPLLFCGNCSLLWVSRVQWPTCFGHPSPNKNMVATVPRCCFLRFRLVGLPAVGDAWLGQTKGKPPSCPNVPCFKIEPNYPRIPCIAPKGWKANAWLLSGLTPGCVFFSGTHQEWRQSFRDPLKGIRYHPTKTDPFSGLTPS